MPNKPTTLRDEVKDLVEQFMSSNDQEMYKDEFIKDILSLLISHNTELLQKIEGIEVNMQAGKESHEYFAKGVEWLKNEVINIINQEK